MKKVCFFFSLILLLGFCEAVLAQQFSFNDNTIYWAYQKNDTYLTGWDDTNSWKATDPAKSYQNNYDELGRPRFADINAGWGTIDDTSGDLTEIYFNYLWGNNLNSGDLFIDINADYQWDYILVTHDADPTNGSAPEKGIYKVTGNFSAFKGINNNYYLLSNDYSDDVRDNHPVAVSDNAPLTKIGDFEFRGFDYDISTPVSFTNFSYTGTDTIHIGVGVPFIIAFTPTCANDVIYEKVPEPSAALFIGLSLFSIGFLLRSRVVK